MKTNEHECFFSGISLGEDKYQEKGVFMRKRLKTDFKPRKDKVKIFGVGELSSISGPTIQLISNKEAIIDGCMGVIDYYDNLIKLRVVGGTVSFLGIGLVMSSLTDDSAEIKGEITSLEFE